MQTIITKLLSFDLERLTYDPYFEQNNAYTIKFNEAFWAWFKSVSSNEKFVELVCEAYLSVEGDLWIDIRDLVAEQHEEEHSDGWWSICESKMTPEAALSTFLSPVHIYIKELEEKLNSYKSLMIELDDSTPNPDIDDFEPDVLPTCHDQHSAQDLEVINDYLIEHADKQFDDILAVNLTAPLKRPS